MSTGSAAIPLLKAAPEADQIADRLDGGDWAGLEVCLAATHVRDDDALAQAIRVVREGTGDGVAVTAEAPVSWPSGAFVSVTSFDDEARTGIERSAAFAAGIGSPVLTIHLFAPQTPDEFRATASLDDEATEAFLRHFAQACADRGVTPLIENVPPVLRMRTGGVFVSRVGGHWRDLLAWRERVPELGFTIDTSHAALFRSFVAAYPSPFGLASAEGLELERYVEELGPAAEVAHVSDAAGILGEGLPYGDGELDLDPVVARLGQLVPYVVAEINEPDHAASPSMKAGYRAVQRALARPAAAWTAPAPRLPADDFDWQAVVGQRDAIPAVLELEERLAGRRVLVTGGGGSIGRALTSLLHGFRPERITVLDAHEASLTADRREREPASLDRIEHALCDIRNRDRVDAEIARAAPDVIFHLAAYKHVDWAERYPEEFVATNLEGSWNVLQAARAAGTRTVVVASTDKAALAASLYGRTKRLMEQLTALSAADGADRIAARLVNVLGSAGSASDLFLRQARAGVPLTVTDTGMVRYWITMAGAASLLAHALLVAGPAENLVAASDAVTLTVGDVAERIWRLAGAEGEPPIERIGVRPGETMSEVIAGPGEELAQDAFPGVAAIRTAEPGAELAEMVAALEDHPTPADRRAAWLAALSPESFAAPAS
jgi:nucleoside-diphosphate-sugar epimerase/sugar phosphate isomerase/epimerase